MIPIPPSEPGSTESLDPVLVEGLRLLESGDSAAWLAFLRAHPDCSTQLERQARLLQTFGFYAGQASASRIGPFKLLRKIGHGGMGIVYRARRDGDDHDCAVKVVRLELLEGEQGRRRFRREIESTKSLDHPGIVRVLEVGIDDEMPWFAMELVDGTSFATMIAESGAGDAVTHARLLPHLRRDAPPASGPDWFEVVVRGLVQVLEALQYAHEHGVTHRDVKPSNIVFEATGRVVLIDFGLAHTSAATTITRTGDTIGSLPYMAPELLRGQRPSAAADLYALGATLYHALARELPFRGANAESIRHGVLRTEPRSLLALDPTLPPGIEPVWRRAMAPEPHRRYQSARAFADDLRALLAGQRPGARLPGPWLRLRRSARRNPIQALAIVGVLLFFVVLPSLLLWVQANELHRAQRLSDLHMVRELAEREPRLWPARPEVVEAPEGMDAWCAQVEELFTRRPRHAADLAAVRDRGRRLSPEEARLGDAARELQRRIDSLRQSMVDATRLKPGSWEDWLAELREHEAPLVRQLHEVESYAFADAIDARLHRHLANLTIALENLAARLQRVKARRQSALRWQQESLIAADTSWRQTLEAIADRGRNPRYRGLTMSPQFGLVPLGQDRESGLFEFAHLPSGEPPKRDASGRLRIEPEHGIVLILLPGGLTRIGADLEPGLPHFDPSAAVMDTPSVEVRLAPFFIGKFEVTQAQWVRQRGHNNNLLKPGERPTPDAAVVTSNHPADVLEYGEVTRILRQWGLRLPTGAQWEHAARGGTASVIWTEGDAASLDGAENLFDAGTALTRWNVPGAGEHVQPADPWPLHAPVGRFRPNPFGLHDVLGNAGEWAMDAVRPYSVPLEGDDGRSISVDYGSLRGGAFNMRANEARVHARQSTLHATPAAGVRAARGIEGPWREDDRE